MKLLTELYTHQKQAVDKLIRYKVGALYMEPGTGKTRTILEMASRRLKSDKIDKIIWLCPCSVKNSLRAELQKHTGDYLKIMICGIESLSMSNRLYSELMRIVSRNRVYLVVDESNLTKTWGAIRTQRIIKIAEKCEYKSILNGTPVSKNEADLFAQWYILDWRILGYPSYYTFARKHIILDDAGRITDMMNVKELTDKIEPFTYQVKKADCVDLPKKKYIHYGFELTDYQRYHYNVVSHKLLLDLDEMESTTIYRLLSGLQSVTSGYYLTGVEYASDNDKRLNIRRKKRYFNNPLNNPRIIRLFEAIENQSDKEQIIIFAKYSDEINEIGKVLAQRYGEKEVAYFYGGLPLKKRNSELQRFALGARFLIANKQCAGYGLNLQYAKTIIFYSQDWDWATKEQAEDRVHRIGQVDDVKIIEIYAERTIDERILANLKSKENLVEALKEEISARKGEDRWRNII